MRSLARVVPCLLMACLAVLAATPSLASADPPTCEERPSDREVRERLNILSIAISHEEAPIRRWWTSFALLHGTMLAGTAVLAATAQDEGYRNEMIVGSVSSLLAVTTIVIFSPALLGAGDTLRGLPEETPEERFAKLEVAESILMRSADTVDFLHSWLPVTGTAAYLTAAAITLHVGLDRVTGAFTHVAGGSILGLGRLLLHPTGSRARYRRYRRRYPACDVNGDPVVAQAPAARWQVFSSGLGGGLRIEF